MLDTIQKEFFRRVLPAVGPRSTGMTFEVEVVSSADPRGTARDDHTFLVLSKKWVDHGYKHSGTVIVQRMGLPSVNHHFDQYSHGQNEGFPREKLVGRLPDLDPHSEWDVVPEDKTTW